MTSASVLFCGRRSRSSNRSSSNTFSEDHSDQTLGFSSLFVSDRFPSDLSSNSDRSSSRGSNNRRHHKTTTANSTSGRRQSRREYDNSNEIRRSSLVPRTSSSRASPSGGCVSVHLDTGVNESPPGQTTDQETDSVNTRRSENTRLPRAVLLARERLLQRLRGAAVSEVRQTREGSAGVHQNDFWLVDAGDWETGISSVDRPAGSSFSTEFDATPNQIHALQEPHRKPPGLTMDALSSLHQETFVEVESSDDHLMLETLNDCSICLESFVEGNSLVKLPCRHRFHASCLFPWAQYCGECPYCRRAITLRCPTEN